MAPTAVAIAAAERASLVTSDGPVLVLDSGVGGLSVAAELTRRMPDLPLAYVADAAFYPYGGREPEALVRRVVGVAEAASRLVQARLLVVACNTASTLALDALRDRLGIPVVGVVPAIKPAARLSQIRVIGLLGTERTVTGSYAAGLIRSWAQDCRVHALASPGLVDLAERVLAGEAEDADLIKAELAPFFAGARPPPDVIVLACTHFPLLRAALEAGLPDGVTVIDSGAAIAARVADLVGPAGFRARAGRLLLTTLDARVRRQLPGYARYGFAAAEELMVPEN